MVMHPRALGRHPDFLKLWTGETISLFGSQVTMLALPLTAVLLLGASAVEMGILTACGSAPFLLVGLPAGVWVDRRRRRPILIGANIGRALLLATIPLSAMLGVLRIEQLYATAFAVGVLTVFFDVAYMAYLPSLVSREQLVDGNAKLELSRSLAQMTGPGVAGGLVQLVGGAIAVAVDAVSYVASAGCLWLIQTAEQSPPSTGQTGIWAELVEGLQTILGNPVLRAIAACTGVWNLFGSASQAIFLLYLVRDLGISPSLTGLVLMALGPGALIGALLAPRLAARFGSGRTICAVPVVAIVPAAMIALPAGPLSVALPVLLIARFFQGLIGTVYNVTQLSLRQRLVPDRLQGRMNATMRFAVWGTLPIGSLAGGVLGEWIGLRGVLMVAILGVVLAALTVILSPVRHLDDRAVSAVV
jgi:MFS family permease